MVLQNYSSAKLFSRVFGRASLLSLALLFAATTLNPVGAASHKEIANSLANVLPIPALKNQVKSLANALKKETQRADYYVARAGNVSLFAFKAKRGGYNAAIVIKGDTTPSFARGVWKHIRGSKLQNMVAFFTAPGNEETLTTSKLPKELGTVAKQTYQSIDLEAGMVIVTQITLNGVLRTALTQMGYPAHNLVARFGAVLPQTNLPILHVPTGYSGSPEAYLEITRKDRWDRPFGLPNASVTDGTFLVTSGGTIGFWGNAKVGTGKYIMRYQGPYNIPTQPADFFDIQLGLGAKSVNLASAMELATSLYLRSAVSVAAYASPVRNAQEATARKISEQIAKLPLGIVEIVNDKLSNYKFKKGDTPTTDKFNYVYLGPAAPKGPLVRKTGSLRILGKKLGSYTSSYGAHGYTESANGSFALDFGKVGGHNIGKISGNLRLKIEASSKKLDAVMELRGKLSGSKIANIDVRFNMNKTGVSFSSKANCAFPFNLEGHLKTRTIADLKLDPLKYNLKASVPNAQLPLDCAREIAYLIQNGAVAAYDGTKKIASVTVNAMKDANIIGDGIRILRGRIQTGIGAPVIEAGNIAANIAQDITNSVGKKLAKSLKKAFESVDCYYKKAVGQSCGGGKPKRPKNAADCHPTAEFWNHSFLKCWPKPLNNREYGLLNYAMDGPQNNDLCADSSDADSKGNQPLNLFKCHARWNQRFVFDPNRKLIRNEKGKCVAVRGGTGGDKNDIVVQTCKKSYGQTWRQDNVGRFISRSNACIVPKKNQNKSRLVAGSCQTPPPGRLAWVSVRGSANFLSKYKMPATVTLRHSSNPNICIDKSHVQTCDRSNTNQHYTLGFIDKNKFVLVNEQAKKCLDIRHKSKKANGEIHLWDCHYEKQQQWTAISVKNGKEKNPSKIFQGAFMMKNLHSSMCFSTDKQKIRSAAKIRQFPCKSTEQSQVFVWQKP